MANVRNLHFPNVSQFQTLILISPEVALSLPIMSHQFPRYLMYALAMLISLVLSSSAFSAAIYKFRDRKGVINYTNVLPKGVTPQIVMVYCPACDPTSKVDFSHVKLKITDFGPHIKAAIAKNPVDEALVRAIIQAESAYNPYALSKAGAQGLMQLMPGTAAQYGVSDSYDAQQNINGGVAYLRFLLDMFDGDVRLASAAYNAGENNVLKYAGVPPFAETQVYVQRVGQLYLRYRADIAAREAKPALPVAAIAANSAMPTALTTAAVSGAVASNPVANPVAASPALASSLTANVVPVKSADAPTSFTAMVAILAASLSKPIVRNFAAETTRTSRVAKGLTASTAGSN